MVEYCSGSDWVTSRTFAWWWTLWYGDLLNLPTVVGGGDQKKNKQTSIWRPSSQTAGCIKGPVCLFRMDPVTFTHPRAGRARTNSVTALERRVQRREKSLVCLPEEVTWPALFHTPYVRKKKSLCFCFCGETYTQSTSWSGPGLAEPVISEEREGWGWTALVTLPVLTRHL